MRVFVVLFTVFLLISCKKDKGELPDGYEIIGKDGRAHFAYVAKKHFGNKVLQREAGKTVCTEIYNHADYCEVYMWSIKEDVPTKLPIINRSTIIGKFELKGETMKLKPLYEID